MMSTAQTSQNYHLTLSTTRKNMKWRKSQNIKDAPSIMSTWLGGKAMQLMRIPGKKNPTSEMPWNSSWNIREEPNFSNTPRSLPTIMTMPSNHSGWTTPYSDVDHPHTILYSPFPLTNSSKSIVLAPESPTYIYKETQTSPTNKLCPIHPHHYSVPTFTSPPFARQIQEPPDLHMALKLCTLLLDPNFITPMHIHYELHSPLFTLYRHITTSSILNNTPMYKTFIDPSKLTW